MDKEGVLKRMIPGLFGKTSKPVPPARGALTAFGGAFLVFALIAGSPALSQILDNAAVDGSSGEIDPNWTIDYGNSEIRFSGTHDGKDFSGAFGSWTADIAFDADALADAAVEVVVQTASARTGTKLYDDSLAAAEWFNVSAFPSAVARLADFAETETGYVAELTLTIKEATIVTPFAFTLEQVDGTTRMNGSTTLTRSALDLGQTSDAGADWVSEEIRVDVIVTASSPQ